MSAQNGAITADDDIHLSGSERDGWTAITGLSKEINPLTFT